MLETVWESRWLPDPLSDPVKGYEKALSERWGAAEAACTLKTEYRETNIKTSEKN